MSAPEKRRITADDLYRLELVSDPQLSPDGRHVIFGLTRVDRQSEKKFTNLWLVPADGSQPPRQFTYGDQTDTQPRWSPDGTAVAFLSNRRDEKQMQLYLIPIAGGEARPLTELKGSFASFAWSPDGRQLVTQFRLQDEEALAREADEQKKKLGVVARHITRLNYKFDGAGYLPQERWHIWTIDAVSGAATQLTSGNTYDETEPAWSPDGRTLVFVSNRDADPDLNWDATELYTIPAGGGEMTRLAATDGRKASPVYAPDGQWIAYMGRPQKGKWYQNDCLYVVPAGGGAGRNLSAEFDLHLSIVTLTDVGSGTPQTPPTWSNDSQWIYSQATDRGNQPLLAFSLAPAADSCERLIDNPGLVGSFSFDSRQSQVAYLWGSPAGPGQVWIMDVASGAARPLTHFNEALLAELNLGEIEEVWFTGPDDTELHGWIMTPPDFDPGQRYPSILEIHGGPQTQYGRVFFHEFHFLAAQGYIVYWSNPRGSQGYGEAFAGAIYNRWGTVDYADIMAWADVVAERPTIDPARMGVTGGSYGGYMTTLIIGRTHRFKAAVAQRVVSNFLSFYGSSDLHTGTEFLFGSEAPPWQDLENYWRQSPIASIGEARTPTLIMHSERDLRCAQEQGEQVFVALKRLGVETELVLFPEESHGLSRAGRTDRRVQRLEHMARWFAKYLA